MHISSCWIKNYKGFRESEEIKFTPGFNVVVGQNNAGKTALTEALSLGFVNNPHKSLTCQPIGKSIVKLVIYLEPQEVLSHLHKKGPFLISIQQNEAQRAACNRIYRLISLGLKVSYQIDENPNMGRPAVVGLQSGHSNIWAHVGSSLDELHPINASVNSNSSFSDVAKVFTEKFRLNKYFFRAERLNIHQAESGTDAVLAPDARNLAEVLNILQTRNPARFRRYIENVRTVFPDIKGVTIVHVDKTTVQINIWFADPTTEREDLAVPLSNCGTGIGQVLAMLYVAINSNEPRTILIDEPQSFLHPGAIRKLFEIFKQEQNQRHQYIITTHSPTVVTACSPCNVIMLYRENNETKTKLIDTTETTELRLFLSDVGARLSDVFGADKILWVEGRTEEICFLKIIQKISKVQLYATEIIGVTHVGDLAGRHKKVVLEIYQKLCEGRGLLPPAIGFCFDREKLSDADMTELSGESKGLIKFIPRRMYENYLLNAKAIMAVLNEVDTGKTTDFTEEGVNQWMNQNRFSSKYIHSSEHADWGKKGDGANLLKDLFESLSETRVSYDKIRHGAKLTDWIVDNSPEDFQELGNFLTQILSSNPAC